MVKIPAKLTARGGLTPVAFADSGASHVILPSSSLTTEEDTRTANCVLPLLRLEKPGCRKLERDLCRPCQYSILSKHILPNVDGKTGSCWVGSCTLGLTPPQSIINLGPYHQTTAAFTSPSGSTSSACSLLCKLQHEYTSTALQIGHPNV